MARSIGYLCFFVLSIVLEACWGGSSDLQCYHCDASVTRACFNSAVKEELPIAECIIPPSQVALKDGQSVTNFTLSKVQDGQFNGIPLITDIILKQTSEQQELTDADYDFYCGKLKLKSGENESLQRRCLVVKKETKDVCNLIKSALDPAIEVAGCNVCNEYICNSSSNIIVSCTLVLLNYLFSDLLHQTDINNWN